MHRFNDTFLGQCPYIPILGIGAIEIPLPRPCPNPHFQTAGCRNSSVSSVDAMTQLNVAVVAIVAFVSANSESVGYAYSHAIDV